MKLAFIGIGRVGLALASNLHKTGHEIVIAHDNVNSESVIKAISQYSSFSVLPIQEAINVSDVIFLATPFKFNQQILAHLDFGGKTLVDCTNPVGAGISHGLESKISGAEKVQEWAGNASVVKSYTIYGFENLQNTEFPNYNVKPAMFVASDHSTSKDLIRSLNTDLGFETVDVGGLSQSLHLEHLTLLWVKMVRAGGHHPNFTWAYLER